jgi:hypothetical protein
MQAISSSRKRRTRWPTRSARTGGRIRSDDTRRNLAGQRGGQCRADPGRLSLQTRFLYRFSASVSRSGSAGGLRPRGRAGDGPDGDQARARLRGEGVALPADLEVASALRRQLAAGALDTQRWPGAGRPRGAACPAGAAPSAAPAMLGTARRPHHLRRHLPRTRSGDSHGQRPYWPADLHVGVAAPCESRVSSSPR